MRPTFLAAALLLSLVPHQAREAPPTGDLATLQGRWRVTAIERGGVTLDGPRIDNHPILIIEGSRYRWENEAWWGTATLFPSLSPKAVDYTYPSPIEGGGRSYRGIYRIVDPDHWQDCFNDGGGPRPRAFSSAGDDAVSCVSYQRETPPSS